MVFIYVEIYKSERYEGRTCGKSAHILYIFIPKPIILLPESKQLSYTVKLYHQGDIPELTKRPVKVKYHLQVSGLRATAQAAQLDQAVLIITCV